MDSLLINSSDISEIEQIDKKYLKKNETCCFEFTFFSILKVVFMLHVMIKITLFFLFQKTIAEILASIYLCLKLMLITVHKTKNMRQKRAAAINVISICSSRIFPNNNLIYVLSQVIELLS